jgi:hypothetical protein
MSARVVEVIGALVAVAVMVAAARAARCNLRMFRLARRTPPLTDIPLAALGPRRRNVPAAWPQADAIDDPATAHGYLRLASDNATALTVVGELGTIVGGAYLGVRLASLSTDIANVLTTLAAALLAEVAVLLRLRGARYWESVFDAYEARYAALTAPTESRPRVGLFGRLLRR